LVTRGVLTFHFNNPPDPDYLQVCLDIPTVRELTRQEEAEVSQETKSLIPSSITEYVDNVSRENHIEMRVLNYRLEIETAKRNKENKREPYYDGAPVDEILRFASIGTGIALEVFGQLETNENTWERDVELAEFIELRLGDELGSDYQWANCAWHFVCNPLLLPLGEGYLTTLLAARSAPALNAIRRSLKISAWAC
jgi:hypothetical protein